VRHHDLANSFDVSFWHKADIKGCPLSGGKADIADSERHVCF
jgi:hypothetical protein